MKQISKTTGIFSSHINLLHWMVIKKVTKDEKPKYETDKDEY